MSHHDKYRRLPLGVQDFEGLRKDNYIYVDKTAQIYELIHTSKQYFLSRPRRFGKSLLLSTLKAYWEGKQELFCGLSIEELEKDNEEAWQEYPVFYFDFNRGGYEKKSAIEDILEVHLREWEALYNIQEASTLSVRFQNLLKETSSQSGKRCVVLVDEYDKPLLENVANPELAEHNKDVFKAFFSTLKSYDAYIQFVFITGVTKFSKVSIFSDLNQLKDISLKKEYASLCGITENELKHIFEPELQKMSSEMNTGLDDCLELLRRTYDGYRFHPAGISVYNPYSVLNALDDKEIRSYWFETGTPTFLVRYLKKMEYDIQKFSDQTLYANESMLSDYRTDNPDPVPLLYQTGYLTITGYDSKRRRYTLGFPNEEVRYGFLENLLPEYTPTAISGNGLDIFTLDKYVETGNTDGIRNVLTGLFADITYTTQDRPFEHYFQTVIYLVFTLLGKHAHTEIHTSYGRIDCTVETDRFIYLFEFKRDASAQEAIEQIEDNGYAARYIADPRKLFRIGMNFDSAKRMPDGWKVME